MVDIYISVGSNISPEENVRRSLESLTCLFGELALSPIYKSTAVGFDGPDFLNLVISTDTERSVEFVVNRLLDMENQQDRDRSQPKFSDRTMDLDLLLYGGSVINNETLTIPRPEITEQIFVLRPLTDLAHNKVHPLSGITYAQLLEEFYTSHPGTRTALLEVDL